MMIKQILVYFFFTYVFSKRMTGRVLGLAYEPIVGVKVTINDIVKATSGAEGLYEVDIEGNVVIGAQDELNYFKSIKVSSNLEDDQIPDLVATSVKLCGSIMMFDENLQLRLLTSENDSFKRKIFLQQQPNPLKGETWDTPGINQTLHETEWTYLDKNGKYCFTALEGLWIIWPELSEQEMSSGVVMDQEDIKCFVQNAGIGFLTMQQINQQVAGRVLCQKRSHCIDLVVSLYEVGMKDEKIKRNTKVSKDGTFKFDLVKEGKWDVVIQQNDFCFKESSHRVKLEPRKSELGIQFEMTGKQIKYDSSHSFTAVAKKDSSELEIEIKKGKNLFCVSESGTWTLSPKKSCLVLSDQISYDYDKLNQPVLNIQVGQLKLEIDIQGEQFDLQGFQLLIGQNRIEQLISAAKFTTFVSLDEVRNQSHLRIEPKMKTPKSLIYFDPHYIDLPISDNCFPPLNFQAKKGIIIEGTVNPPLKGVNIKATSLNQQGQSQEYFGQTGTDGKYRIGPVDDVEFYITASFEDHALTQLNKRDFSVVKVAMIEVGCKCKGVVRVAGRKGLVRQGTVKEGGLIKFSNLEPDLYSVTCVHPDYKFENAEVMLIAQKHVHLALRGKQTAVSIKGKFNPNSIVVATQNGQVQAHSTSDSDGNFTIPGLALNQEFELQTISNGKLQLLRKIETQEEIAELDLQGIFTDSQTLLQRGKKLKRLQKNKAILLTILLFVLSYLVLRK